MTPTEAAAVSAVYAIFAGWICYKSLSLRKIGDVLKETATTTGVIMVNLFMIIIGMLMDDVSSVLLCTPLLLPIVQSVGVNPIHFAAILCVNISLGCVTPPCAPLLYLASRLSGTPVSQMMKPTLQLIAFVWIPALILVTFIPQLSLFLPGLISG